jgi:hypothetical protein
MSPEAMHDGPPWEALRGRLEQEAAAREAAGDATTAVALRAIVASWWADQQVWNGRFAEVLAVHH